MPIYIIALIVFGVLLLAWIAVGFFSSKVEQLQYTVIDSSKEYEVRQIDEHLIIETEVEGGFEAGSNEAFRILAGYIFGNNKKKEKIAMTAPVVEGESEKIAMTAPVIATESEKIAMTAPVIATESEKIAMTAPVISDKKNSTFSFVLPAKYTLETLPDPIDPRLKIRKENAKKVGVLTFSGFFTDKNFNKKKELLKKYLKRDNVRYSKIYSASYNPPWTPPFMRRLEVWAELE